MGTKTLHLAILAAATCLLLAPAAGEGAVKPLTDQDLARALGGTCIECCDPESSLYPCWWVLMPREVTGDEFCRTVSQEGCHPYQGTYCGEEYMEDFGRRHDQCRGDPNAVGPCQIWYLPCEWLHGIEACWWDAFDRCRCSEVDFIEVGVRDVCNWPSEYDICDD